MQGGDGGQADSSLLSPRSVLLVDEAGMVGSAELAALIEAADAAQAKLVLVGDHQQLGEIEAGGLYRALAERGDPILLDEVIRHNHDVDREAARMIREGEGRAALELYRSEERVTVAPDAEARREAMVADWHRAYQEGQDALMVAKRNTEVGRLNATARELLKAEGQLGAQEIEVGEARFAAGDQVITRVNDHAAAIYNRERWQVEQVDPEQGRVVLSGVDQQRTVEIGLDYLSRTTPHGEAPALQHAYAVTTYCAQGSTVDRAYVMADPSMDKQELYVAMSRSREETYLYATPEIQAERAEYAPRVPEGDATRHIGDAAVRDRAQTAAHAEALRAELSALPSDQLAKRQLRAETAARHEAQGEGQYTYRREYVEQRRAEYAEARAYREAVEGMGWRQRRQQLPGAEEGERMLGERLREAQGQLAEVEPPKTEARCDAQVVSQVLAERQEKELLAARLSPPPYISMELGDRPQSPYKAREWDKAVQRIESYRHGHGITSRDNALGREGDGSAEGWQRRAAQEALRSAQRRLDLQRQLDRSMQRSREMSHGHDLGIGR
jgi:hypothetical protein